MAKRISFVPDKSGALHFGEGAEKTARETNLAMK